MLNETQRQDIIDFFCVTIQGGSNEDFITLCDHMIEYGLISQKQFNEDEMEIARLFDDEFFQCESCDWTLPIADMSESEEDGRICRDCERK